MHQQTDPVLLKPIQGRVKYSVVWRKQSVWYAYWQKSGKDTFYPGYVLNSSGAYHAEYFFASNSNVIQENIPLAKMQLKLKMHKN